MVGLDGSAAHQVSNVQKRGALEFQDFRPAFSPDGKRLVFERTRLEDDRHAVFVQSLDLWLARGCPSDHAMEDELRGFSTALPNGNLVLFSCDPEGDPHNLYRVHPDGTGLDQLTHTDADKHYWGSSFSPEFHQGWGDIAAARWLRSWG